jgi:hypothetical protein
MGIKQHFVTLAGVGHQPEGATGAQLHVGDLHAVVDAAHHHAFLAPVKLEGFTQIELQGHEGFEVFTSVGAPGADVVGDPGVATCIATGLDLCKQCARRTSVFLWTQRVGFEGLFQLVSEGVKFAVALGPDVSGRFHFFGGLKPFVHRVAGESCALCDGTLGELVAHLHAPDFA